MNKKYSLAFAITVAIGASGCNQAYDSQPTKVKQTKLQVVQLGNATPNTVKHFSGIVHAKEMHRSLFAFLEPLNKSMSQRARV